ncbi:MAG: hypothetical protein WCT99_10965 [Bacteroidota bacterium]
MKAKRRAISFLTGIIVVNLFFVSCKKEDSSDPVTPPPQPAGWSVTTFPALKVISLYTSKAGYLFAGTDSNGIYRSVDGGTTWSSVNNGIVQFHVNSITENSSGVLYAGTSGAAIYRSTNQGALWEEIDPFGSGNADTYCVAVNSNGDIFAGLNLMGWVLRSTNGGTSWTSLTVSSSVYYIYSIAIDTSGKLFAGTASGIYVSTNNGTSWSKPTTTFSTTDVLTVGAAANGYVWAGTFDKGIYYSNDHGVTWNSSSLSTGRVNAVCYDGTTLFIGTTANGVYSSKNNGITASSMNDNLPNLNVYALTIHGGTTMFAGTQNGIFKITL